MSVSFESYKVFYIVASKNSISAAAQELFVTQPTITHCIKKMEEELHCQLFIRGKKGVTLTAEGELVYKHAKIACENIWDAEEKLHQLKRYEIGTLSLGTNETTFHHFLFPYLKKYRKSYPGIHLQIISGSTPAIIQKICDHQLDCSILITPETYQNELLEIVKLGTIKDIIVAGTHFNELENQPVSLAKLQQYPLVGFSENTISGIEQRQYFQEFGAIYRPDIEIESADLIVPTVANNLGIGVVPEVFAQAALGKKEIFEVQVTEKPPIRNISLIYFKHQPITDATSRFMELFTT